MPLRLPREDGPLQEAVEKLNFEWFASLVGFSASLAVSELKSKVGVIDHGRLEVPGGVIHGGIQTRMIGILGLKAAIRLGFLRFSFEAIDTSGDITPVCILYKVKYFFDQLNVGL